MAGQLWATSTQGGYMYSPLLTREVTAQAQPDMKFAQFCELREQWGKNAGETFLYDKYGNIDTQGGTLTETSTIPSRGHRFYQSTATLYEWGKKLIAPVKPGELRGTPNVKTRAILSQAGWEIIQKVQRLRNEVKSLVGYAGNFPQERLAINCAS